MPQPTPTEIELGQRVYWLIRLRWVAASTIIYGTFAATSILGFEFDPLPLYLIGGAVAVYNSLYLVGLKWSEAGAQRSHPRRVRWLANGQIVTDLLFLTLLIHFTGGIENPIAFYFIFHVIVASILLSRLETFLQATVACALYGALVLTELFRLVPHVSLLAAQPYHLAWDRQFVTISLAVFVSTLYLAAYLATSITERLRRRDSEIVRLSSELERKVLELEKVCGNLQELEQMKSQQLGEVSHQIKPRLAAIQEWLHAALDSTAGETGGTQSEAVSRAERGTDELLALVSEMHLLSKAREARQFAERKPVDLAKLIERVVAAHSERASSRGVSLSIQPSQEPVTVTGDAAEIEQLLGHLVSNAVSYTLNGGKIEIRLDRTADLARFQVADTGIGIPSSDLPRVFDEFFRSENARRYREQGTGLGLSIARTIAESHGGQVEVESQVGTGTTVTLVLPACREHAARSNEPATA